MLLSNFCYCVEVYINLITKYETKSIHHNFSIYQHDIFKVFLAFTLIYLHLDKKQFHSSNKIKQNKKENL